MSGGEGRKVAVVGGGAAGTASLVAAILAGAGHSLAIVGHDDALDHLDLHRRPDLMDRLDVLSMVLGHGGDRPQDSMGFRHPHPPARREIAFIDTPKPLSKRRARRLRGKVSA